MIEIARVNKADAAVHLQAPGSFTWWYLDLCNNDGEGIVVVWSLGLPFLPGSRNLGPAQLRPSVLVSYFRSNIPELHLLQEFDPDAASLDVATGNGVIGESRFTISRQAEQLRVSIQLELQVPQSDSTFSAEVDVIGTGLSLSEAESGAAHVWSPSLLFSEGQAQLRHGDEVRSFTGTAYFDANISRCPLHDQQIESWRWGRIRFHDETLVYYDITTSDGARQPTVVSQDADGTYSQRTLSLDFDKKRSGAFGLAAPRQVKLSASNISYVLELSHLIEDGPFYQRYVIAGERRRRRNHNQPWEQSDGHGIAEFVMPSRIDLLWQRAFVRMRTERVGKRNSIMLPLFTGFVHDRVDRLARSLVGRFTS